MSWRCDLQANAQRQGLKGGCLGWLSSPGFVAVTLFRVVHSYATRGKAGKVLSLLAWRRLVHTYGCYFAPSASIGEGLRLPHPISIVVGEGVTIGRNVTIYQGVTFGRRSEVSADYPIVEDDVVIYANAILIGGIRIGKGAVIAAGAIVRRDVQPGETFR